MRVTDVTSYAAPVVLSGLHFHLSSAGLGSFVVLIIKKKCWHYCGSLEKSDVGTRGIIINFSKAQFRGSLNIANW
jgi:hypothetical protein